ncbi:MAG: phosphoserine phosphatase SerB [Thaumarchaeota archaeon]|nr:phosphoserine phosphatase SerB [Nitrososphaerota archaeon]
MLGIFDIEGVLVDGEFLPEIAARLGKKEQVLELTLKGIRGEIDWETGLNMRIDAVKGASYDECVEVAKNLQLMNGAADLIKALNREGWRLAAVSGGFSLLSDRVKSELGIDFVFSNQLVFQDEKLVGVKLNVKANKAAALANLVDTLGEPKEKIMAVVDGANDLKLFEIAGIRIAFNAQPIVQRRADYVINEKNLLKVLDILRMPVHPATSRRGSNIQ